MASRGRKNRQLARDPRVVKQSSALNARGLLYASEKVTDPRSLGGQSMDSVGALSAKLIAQLLPSGPPVPLHAGPCRCRSACQGELVCKAAMVIQSAPHGVNVNVITSPMSMVPGWGGLTDVTVAS
jgi:hypothetical protein